MPVHVMAASVGGAVVNNKQRGRAIVLLKVLSFLIFMIETDLQSNGIFFVQRYISRKLFMQIRSVDFT